MIRPQSRRSRLLLGLAGVTVAGLTAYVCAPRRGTSERATSPELASFVAAAGAARPTPGRLVAGFGYAPFAARAEPPAAPASDAELAIRRRGAAPDATVVERRALATVHLFYRRSEEAIRLLERAGARSAEAGGRKSPLAPLFQRGGPEGRPEESGQSFVDAALASDLAAAYLAGAAERPFRRVRAVAAADRALALAPALAAARWNRALALESLSLRAAARAAWRDYLALDGVSPWAAEARQRLETLETVSPWPERLARLERAATAGDHETVRRLVLADPQWTREHAEKRLLAAWATSAMGAVAWEAPGAGSAAERSAAQRGTGAGWRAAAETLAVARAVGRVLAAELGEHLLADAVAAIDAASASGVDRIAALQHGHRRFGDGLVLFNRHRASEARALLVKATGELETGETPFAGWAAVFVASCDLQLGEYPRALERLDALAARLDADRYPTLAARVGLLRGLIHATTGDPMRALISYRDAVATLTTRGLEQDAAYLHGQLAWLHDYLGRGDDAWRHRLRALAATASSPDPRRLHVVFDEAAGAIERAGEPAVALYFRDEVRRQGEALVADERTSLAFALLRRAETLHRLGRTDDALREIDRAAREIEQIPSAAERERERASLDLAAGEVLLATDPEAAVRRLTAALDYLRAREHRASLVRAALLRARAHLATGGDDLARRDLELGIENYERERRRLGDEGLRRAHFEQAQALFDEQIRLHWRRPEDRDRAFRYSERKRARELLDLLGGTRADVAIRPAASPLPIDTIQTRLPAGTTLVEYALLDDRVLAWVVRPGTATAVEIPVAAGTLNERIEWLLDALQRKAPEADLHPVSERLYADLIAPVLFGARDGELLVVVPDKTLHALPFAALRNPATGRYLVEERPLAVAPSATFYLASADPADVRSLASTASPGTPGARTPGARMPGTRTPGARTPRVLLVGDPPILRARFPDLPPLTAAADAVARIEPYYPDARVLAGERATPRNFLDAAAASDLVHFGGHARASFEVPATSRLYLASGAGSELGVLYAREIRRASLARTRLVVLAACDSGRGPISSTEGVLSLARPFLLAGVDAALVSLWQADDAAAAELTVVFHRELAAGRDAARALAAAQRALRAPTSPHRSPHYWAGFQLIGRAVSFPFS